MMLRGALAVIAGYAIFALAAVALFQISGRDPHTAAPVGFMVFAIVYGAVFAAIGGYVATAISGRRAAAIVAFLVLFGAVVSMLFRPGKGALWTMLSTAVISTPMVAFGSRLRRV
jgi:hypothetical protein